MSPPDSPSSPAFGSPSPEITIRRIEWEPDEQLSSRTWAYTALVADRPAAVQAVVFRADGTVLYLTPDFKRGSVTDESGVAAVVRRMAEQIQQDLAPLEFVFQQAAIDPEDAIGTAALEAAGFQELTDVCELRRAIDAAEAFEMRTSEVAVDLVAPSPESPFWQQAFEASLAGGLDVPELLARRGPAESFESLRLLAGEETEHWRVALCRGELAGLVLPTALPDGTAEIQYMGVAEGHRRKGIGRRLVADAIEAAADVGASELVVQVDARNLPALGLYRSMGFRDVTRRGLWLK